jgi:hypothetical protein
MVASALPPASPPLLPAPDDPLPDPLLDPPVDPLLDPLPDPLVDPLDPEEVEPELAPDGLVEGGELLPHPAVISVAPKATIARHLMGPESTAIRERDNETDVSPGGDDGRPLAGLSPPSIVKRVRKPKSKTGKEGNDQQTQEQEAQVLNHRLYRDLDGNAPDET